MNVQKKSSFPTTRLRRLRYHDGTRSLLAQTTLSPHNLILPLFVCEGHEVRRTIKALPGHFQLSPDQLALEVRQLAQLELGGVIVFGISGSRDATGSASWQEAGVVQRALRAAKEAAPNLLLVTDVCLCGYTDHGHCGVTQENSGHRDVDNDQTLTLLAQQALSHVRAGADMVAPSGMMDGMVQAIRTHLDREGCYRTPIMSYAAKYASAFYGPFREAAQSTPQFGDRHTYQMDPAGDSGQALREVKLDLEEGADLVMVKPALPYLDVIRRVHDHFPGVPLAAYNVSGEYSMIKAACAQGWMDEKAAVLESLTAIHRAGAGIVLTYWAKDVAKWLNG